MVGEGKRFSPLERSELLGKAGRDSGKEKALWRHGY